MALSERLERHERIAAALDALEDAEFERLLETARPLGVGIGGARSLLDLDGEQVFVKQVPLSDLERHPDNVGSTRNHFAVPMACQFGIGSPGFGVWRELAANKRATAAMVGGRAECFALMHHWRVVETPARRQESDVHVIARVAEVWHHDPAVVRRVEAATRASATVTMVLEYAPIVLESWLANRVSARTDPNELRQTLASIERSLLEGVTTMNGLGLFHFDTHFTNILMLDDQPLFADFGLVTSPSFELDADERRFLETATAHDHHYTMARLVDWLVTALTVAGWRERDRLIRACAQGEPLPQMDASAADLITRHAPVAAVINSFYNSLRNDSTDAPYPTDDLPPLAPTPRS